MTRLGWLGCGGRSPLEENQVKVCRVQAWVSTKTDITECAEIAARDNRISEMKQVLKDITFHGAEVLEIAPGVIKRPGSWSSQM